MPAGVSTSCSSAMSPTISSMMSSSVISPCSAPYSSTTSAKCARRRRNSRICSSSGVDLRHEVGLHRHVHDVEALERALAAVLLHEAVHRPATGPWRGCTPTMFSGSPRKIGMRVCGELIACARISSGGASASIISMSRRCIITSSTWRWPRSSAPSSRSRSAFSTEPSEWLQGDRAGDLLLGGEEVRLRVGLDPEERAGPAARARAPRSPPARGRRPATPISRRPGPPSASGLVIGVGLGHHLREDQHQRRHRPASRSRRRRRRRARVKSAVASEAARMLTEVVAEQERADQPLPVLGQRQRRGGAGVAALGHGRAACRGSRWSAPSPSPRTAPRARAARGSRPPFPRGRGGAGPRSGGPWGSSSGGGTPALCGHGRPGFKRGAASASGCFSSTSSRSRASSTWV